MDNDLINIFQNSKNIRRKFRSLFSLLNSQKNLTLLSSINNTLLYKENRLTNLLTRLPQILSNYSSLTRPIFPPSLSIIWIVKEKRRKYIVKAFYNCLIPLTRVNHGRSHFRPPSISTRFSPAPLSRFPPRFHSRCGSTAASAFGTRFRKVMHKRRWL